MLSYCLSQSAANEGVARLGAVSPCHIYALLLSQYDCTSKINCYSDSQCRHAAYISLIKQTGSAPKLLIFRLRTADLPWHSAKQQPHLLKRPMVIPDREACIPSLRWIALTSLVHWLFATGPDPLQPLVSSSIIHLLIYNVLRQPDLQCNGYFSTSVVRRCFPQLFHFPRLLRLRGLKGVSECHVVGAELWRWFSRFFLKPNMLFMHAFYACLIVRFISEFDSNMNWLLSILTSSVRHRCNFFSFSSIYFCAP